ncbi:LLM class F420-dependent oxidoreductase [Streptomyces sp. VRA16 Mangrove soil]|uniref:LLM class F420-dependent oxidoreductase n=1 Tax=Streptomyces sp. VRA16 Mangrove soil TaxID=2817434 RepID=UPI001A9CCFF1|nr:LLM class F420-dependent oxidoreductase [Streptomyces sp. VRA16 Mangrove soil]MBO1332404.1 LLM class F420-dependent oxidoreductase [Streptomyces sp. VRA16 Mangrove soil]
MPRPFRFGVNMVSPAPDDAWRAKCRRAEELGYDVILVPDHLGAPAPFPALVAAAGATTRPQVGTFVLNCAFWNPVLLAREVTTVNALTGGRLELGLGTGYVREEFEQAGVEWGTPGGRVDHLLRTVEELDRQLGSPEQGPRPPLLIGGNGDRMLRIAAEHADIAAFTGARPAPGNAGGLLPLPARGIGERVAAYRKFAAHRAEPAELNLLVQMVIVTQDRGAAVRPWLRHMPDLTEQDLLDSPLLLVGTVEEITAQVLAVRERYGVSYLTVLEPHFEALGPVIEAVRAHEGRERAAQV